MSVVSDFHCANDFSAYDAISTSWKELGVDATKVKRDALGNAVLSDARPDMFTKTVSASAKQEVKQEIKQGLSSKLGSSFKKLGNTISKHKGVSALIAAGVALGGVILAKATGENKEKNNKQNFYAKNYQG